MKLLIKKAGNVTVNGIFLKEGVKLTLKEEKAKETIAWLKRNAVEFEEVKEAPAELTDETITVEKAKAEEDK